MAPVRSDSTPQFVPNWNAITTPVTTPIPNDTANTFNQKSNTRRYTGFPVASRMPSIVASHAARPSVKEGKIMWKLITKANCRRERKTGSRLIWLTPRCGAWLRPQSGVENHGDYSGDTAKDRADRRRFLAGPALWTGARSTPSATLHEMLAPLSALSGRLL